MLCEKPLAHTLEAARAMYEVDEVTDMLVEFAGGVTGTLQTSWLAGGHKMDVGFAVHGTKGSVEYTSERPTEVRLYRTAIRPVRAGSGRSRSAPRTPAGSCSGRWRGWRSGSGRGSRSRCGTCC